MDYLAGLREQKFAFAWRANGYNQDGDDTQPIDFRTDAGFVKTWDTKGIELTYSAQVKSALLWIKHLAGGEIDFTSKLPDLIRHHSGEFARLAHIMWCKTRAETKSGVWPHNSVGFQRERDEAKLCDYFLKHIGFV